MIVGRKPRANLKLMPSDTQKKSMKCLATGAVTSLDFALVNCSMNHCQRRLMSTRSDSSDDEEDEINRGKLCLFLLNCIPNSTLILCFINC